MCLPSPCRKWPVTIFALPSSGEDLKSPQTATTPFLTPTPSHGMSSPVLSSTAVVPSSSETPTSTQTATTPSPTPTYFITPTPSECDDNSGKADNNGSGSYSAGTVLVLCPSYTERVCHLGSFQCLKPPAVCENKGVVYFPGESFSDNCLAWWWDYLLTNEMCSES